MICSDYLSVPGDIGVIDPWWIRQLRHDCKIGGNQGARSSSIVCALVPRLGRPRAGSAESTAAGRPRFHGHQMGASHSDCLGPPGQCAFACSSQSSFSITFRRASGFVVGANRVTTSPWRSTRNLVKFHLMLSLPSRPRASFFSHRNRGLACGPLTSTFANIGKLTS
jgi:hypothetical protein